MTQSIEVRRSRTAAGSPYDALELDVLYNRIVTLTPNHQNSEVNWNGSSQSDVRETEPAIAGVVAVRNSKRRFLENSSRTVFAARDVLLMALVGNNQSERRCKVSSVRRYSYASKTAR